MRKEKRDSEGDTKKHRDRKKDKRKTEKARAETKIERQEDLDTESQP